MSKITERVLKECKDNNVTLITSGEFKSRDKIELQCNVCNKKYKTDSRYTHYGCPRCNKWSYKYIDTESFKDDLKHYYGDRYTLLGEYKGGSVPVLVRCNDCKTEWKIRYTDIINAKHGCPTCATNKKVVKKVELRDQDIKIKDYTEKNNVSLIKLVDKIYYFKCNTCNKKYNVREKNLYRTKGCPRCENWSPRDIDTNYYKDDIMYYFGDKFTILGEYEKNNVPVLTKCNICNNDWNVRPRDLLYNGHGCPTCAKNNGTSNNTKKKINMGRDIFKKMTKERFEELLFSFISKDDYEISAFENLKEPIAIRHKSCKHMWVLNQTQSLLNSAKTTSEICPECRTTPKPYTRESLEEKINEITKDKYIVSDTFTNIATPIEIIHEKCNGITLAPPSDFLYRMRRCACEKKAGSSAEEENVYNFITSVYEGNIIRHDRKVLNGKELDIFLPDLNIAVEYNGLYWHSNFIKRNFTDNCHQDKVMECAKQGIRLITIFENKWKKKSSRDNIKKILKSIIFNPNVKIKSQNLNYGLPLNLSIDNVRFTIPNKMYLNNTYTISKDITECYTVDCGTYIECELTDNPIIDILVRNEIEYTIMNDTITVDNFKIYYIDLELLKRNTSMNQYLDIEKENTDAGYQSLFFYSTDIQDKEKLIEKKLLYILKKTNLKSIYARKCHIEEIESSEKNKFLKEHHIQGEDKSAIKLGLYYEDVLVSVMTFGKPRVSLGHKGTNVYDYELIRFASHTDYRIVGGFSKLLKYFKVNYPDKVVVTYADKKYSNGNLYTKNGFTLIRESKPSYNYYKDGKLENRFKYRKSELKALFPTLYSDSKTEQEIMIEAGYIRVFNLGNYVYKY